ncbi:hypothetical protein J437_LFUL013035, partial [Ladona fulva]
MDGVLTLRDDLGDLMKSFHHWKETFLETTKANREMHGMIEVLREELRIARDLERTERYRDASNCDVLTKQQTLIDELVGVRDENIRMSSRMMDLEKSYNDLKKAERNEHFQKLESVRSCHSFEMKQLKIKAENDVHSMKNELEEKCSEFLQRYQEIAEKLKALEVEKNEEVSL